MKLLVDNKEVPFLGLSAHESLDQYYPYFLLSVPAQIRTNKIQLQDSTTDTYYILRGEFQKGTYTYTIVPESINQILNRTYPSYTGSTTIQGLLNTLSIKNNIKDSTGIVPWRMPMLKFTNLLNHLTKFTVVSRGGAPKYFLDLNGILNLYDLRLILSRDNPTKITSFSITSDQLVQDWILRDVGAVNIYSGGKTSSKFTIESDMGLATASVNDTTGDEVGLVKRVLTTSYYLKKYTARRVTINEGINNLSIGDLVTINETDKFVVYSRAASIPMNNEPAQVSYVLVSPIW